MSDSIASLDCWDPCRLQVPGVVVPDAPQLAPRQASCLPNVPHLWLQCQQFIPVRPPQKCLMRRVNPCDGHVIAGGSPFIFHARTCLVSLPELPEHILGEWPPISSRSCEAKMR